MPTDERQDLPSASAYPRDHACPGARNLIRTLPQAVIDAQETDAATSGTRVHAAMAGELPESELTGEEERIFGQLKSGEDLIVERCWNAEKEHEVLTEKRLWAYDLGQRISSGKPDRVLLAADAAIIIDHKTGRIEAEKADGNLQLRELAVLVWQNFPQVKTVFVAVNQPWFDPPVSIAEYGENELRRAWEELLDDLATCEAPDAPRMPGEHCRYCPAKGICPEFQASAGAVLAVAGVVSPALATKESVALAISGLTLGQLASALERRHVLAWAKDALEDTAKALLDADPAAVPGWSLKPGNLVEKVTDAQTVYGRAVAQGVPEKNFLAAVTISKTALKDLLKVATGQKGKALDAALETLVAGCTTAKQNAPTLVKLELTP